MPGQFYDMQRSAMGPKRSLTDTVSTSVLLPVFREPLFHGHNVQNWVRVPKGRAGHPDEDSMYPARSFEGGQDTNGWGLHINGVVDCINTPMCREFSSAAVTPDNNWPLLWDLEATWTERLMAGKDPTSQAIAYKVFLKRMIIRVELSNDVVRVPAENQWHKWLVYTNLDLSQTSARGGVSGILVRRPVISEQDLNERSLRYTEFGDARKY